MCAQGTGQSRGAGATYHGGNIYVAGMAYALCLSPVYDSYFLLAFLSFES